MILWAGVLGTIVGWSLADSASLGFILGGLFGMVAGWFMQRGIRAEVATATGALQEQIDGLLARESAYPVASASDAPADRTATSPSTIAQVTLVPPATSPDRPTVAASTPRTDTRDPSPGTPSEPGVIQALVSIAKDWLFGGNTIVRIGLVILFVGLSFLASYAASAGLFPIELRLALVVAIGIVLLTVGFRARTARPGFGLALQGGGIATVYLALFAGARLYDTFPVAAAFVLMIVVCALGCALALLQRSQALAGTAFAGGFAVPLLLASFLVQTGLAILWTLSALAMMVLAYRGGQRALWLVGAGLLG